LVQSRYAGQAEIPCEHVGARISGVDEQAIRMRPQAAWDKSRHRLDSVPRLSDNSTSMMSG
jgi:hypothetical protein